MNKLLKKHGFTGIISLLVLLVIIIIIYLMFRPKETFENEPSPSPPPDVGEKEILSEMNQLEQQVDDDLAATVQVEYTLANIESDTEAINDRLSKIVEMLQQQYQMSQNMETTVETNMNDLNQLKNKHSTHVESTGSPTGLKEMFVNEPSPSPTLNVVEEDILNDIDSVGWYGDDIGDVLSADINQIHKISPIIESIHNKLDTIENMLPKQHEMSQNMEKQVEQNSHELELLKNNHNMHAGGTSDLVYASDYIHQKKDSKLTVENPKYTCLTLDYPYTGRETAVKECNEKKECLGYSEQEDSGQYQLCTKFAKLNPGIKDALSHREEWYIKPNLNLKCKHVANYDWAYQDSCEIPTTTPF